MPDYVWAGSTSLNLTQYLNLPPTLLTINKQQIVILLRENSKLIMNICPLLFN